MLCHSRAVELCHEHCIAWHGDWPSLNVRSHPFSSDCLQAPLPEPAYCHSQRWGRAFAAEPLGTEFLFLPSQRLALCGDVAAGSSIEAAWRSGQAAGGSVGRMLAPGPAAAAAAAAGGQ